MVLRTFNRLLVLLLLYFPHYQRMHSHILPLYTHNNHTYTHAHGFSCLRGVCCSCVVLRVGVRIVNAVTRAIGGDCMHLRYALAALQEGTFRFRLFAFSLVALKRCDRTGSHRDTHPKEHGHSRASVARAHTCLLLLLLWARTAGKKK